MAKDMKRKLLELVNKMEKKGTPNYFVKNGVFSDRDVKEHQKGHRPIKHIENEYFEDLELDVSMEFFKWYLDNYCECCDCEPCGCDKGCCTCGKYSDAPLPKVTKPNQKLSKETNISEHGELVFYDIIACSNQLKKEDIKALKLEYKNHTNNTNQPKSMSNISTEYYYAKIEYYISPNKWEKQRHEDYAIVLGDLAYIKPSGKYSKFHIKEDTKKHNTKVLEKYFRRPKDMKKEVAENILSNLAKKHSDLKLTKPNKKDVN